MDQTNGEIAQLQQEIRDLKAENRALNSQKEFIENLLSMTRVYPEKEIDQFPSETHNFVQDMLRVISSSNDKDRLDASLKDVLNSAVQLTHAEKGSIFLLNQGGELIHSIITQERLQLAKQIEVVNQVLKDGLAGWVYENKKTGLIVNTDQDDRWLQLPNQPYTVGSALAIPILKGKELLAIITLLHSTPGHFNEAIANLMEIAANQLALTLELYSLKVAHRKEHSAIEIQKQLLDTLIQYGEEKVSREESLILTTLQKIVDLSVGLTRAETCSLFLLDKNRKITNAILSRTQATAQQKVNLIGNVLDKGLAGWVSKHRQIGLILDTENDDRWLTLPNQPYQVRSALAVPILRGDKLLGILTLLHSVPNYFNSDVAEHMKIMSDHIGLILENARLYSKLDEYSKALDSELEKGRKIQIDFLPYEICQPGNWEIAACFRPARQVAGDFYDVFYLNDRHHVGLVLADVCDKGVGAALFMALFRSLIRIFSDQSNLHGSLDGILESHQPPNGWLSMDNPADIRTHLNALSAVKLANDYVALVHPNLCMFATLFYGILDPATGLLTYINGGHEPLFVFNQQGIKQTLNPTSPAVGIMPNSTFKVGQIILEPGDYLLGYTDGVTEGKNQDGEQYRVHRLLSHIHPPLASAEALLSRITDNLFDYIGDAPQFDDITMIAVKRLFPE
ncbi:MAG: SpoIIE family protein phosphatase [Synechocystis sp.]|nr:SpoIIE family protein phosphatase [Synechocystis sp.]